MIGIYFGVLKFGHKVGSFHTFSSGKFVAPGIAHVTLTNLKDRSTPIFALYAVHGNVVIELREFKDPLVLKSFDSVQVEIPRVSEYIVDDAPYLFRPTGSVKTHIYYATTGKWKRCVPLYRPHLDPRSLARDRMLRKLPLKRAFVLTQSEGDKVYSTNVIYIMRYVINGKWDFAFIDSAGLISWKILPNVLPSELLANPQGVADALAEGMSFLQRVEVQKTIGWHRKFAGGAMFHHGVDDEPVLGRRRTAAGDPAPADRKGLKGQEST